jgi:PTH1 family peptidyl-tRNA hydrolase
MITITTSSSINVKDLLFTIIGLFYKKLLKYTTFCFNFFYLMYNINMILIAGLGNPENKYENTPHNIGFRTIDLLKERFNFPEFSVFESALMSKKNNVILIKPQTYMNNSGIPIKQIVSYYKIKIDDVWVIHDENKLKLGELEINKNIPASGHNGIKSIIERLGMQDFVRFRIGINNKEKHDLMDYVLKPFSKKEQEIINEVIYKTTSALDEAIQNGVEQAMLKFNIKQ